MTKPSSNISVEKQLEILHSIKKVEAPDSLLGKIQQRIENVEAAVIPMNWISVAAAVAVLFISIDVYVIKQNSTSKTNLTELVPSQNNYLYHE